MVKPVRAILLLAICLLYPQLVMAKTPVNVGLTSVMPPFVINDQQKHGLVYDLVDALNDLQSDYYFSTTLYPTKRLRAIYEDSRTHMVAFVDVRWGWEERGGKGSIPLTNGKDLFVKLREEREEEDGGTLAAVRGFHYAFADYSAEKLATNPNVTLVRDEESVLQLVLRERVSKGIVSAALLSWYSVHRPESHQRLLIDHDNPDHTYTRQFVVLPHSPVNLDVMNGYFKRLYGSGELQNLFAKYGLQLPENKEFLGL
ncbi:MAG: hypothetical protein JJ879_08820 [Sneathiella sp.]|nr:hypothetical protein [Sneathiella sp.]